MDTIQCQKVRSHCICLFRSSFKCMPVLVWYRVKIEEGNVPLLLWSQPEHGVICVQMKQGTQEKDELWDSGKAN